MSKALTFHFMFGMRTDMAPHYALAVHSERAQYTTQW
jgi:hypothetical protein